MSLLARLKSVGRYDSTGQFTLDEVKAVAKLSRFQLTDPRRFVLEVVRAAVAGGAQVIEVTTGPRLSVAWRPGVLDAEVLEDLERHLLESVGAERHLAVAMNAARQLEPASLQVESACGAALDALSGRLRRGRFAVNRVLVEGLAAGLRDELAQLIRSEACWCPCELRLDGQEARAGLEVFGSQLQRSQDGFDLQVGLDPGLARSEVLLVQSGVLAGRRQPSWEVPTRALVRSERLSLNVSHSEVVEDEALVRALQLVEELGRQALEELVEGAVDLAPHLELFLRARLRPAHAGTRWWDLKLFPTVEGGRVSARAVAAQRAALGAVLVSEHPVVGTPSDVTVLDREAQADLVRVFGEVQDARIQLVERLRREANRQAWERGPLREPRLGDGQWLVRACVSGPHFEAEVGLEAQDVGPGSQLEVLYQGRSLSLEEVPNRHSYRAVVNFRQLELRSDWSGPQGGPLYKAACQAVEEQAERLYEELSSRDLERALPGVRSHLLAALESSRGSRVKLFWSLRLFLLATGGAVSLEALEEARAQGQTLYLLAEGEQLPELPAECLPPGMILASGQPLLKRLLGSKLKPLGKLLPELEALSRRLRERWPAVLPAGPDRVTLEGGPVRGQLALDPEETGGFVEVLRDGVRLGEPRRLKASLCGYRAIVDHPGLKPHASYRSFVQDGAWEQVRRVLQDAHQQALARLLESPPLGAEWDPVLLRLLEARPHEAGPRLRRRALFKAIPGAVGLDEVGREQARRGRVAVANVPPPDALSVLEVPFILLHPISAALPALVEGLHLERCEDLARERSAQRDFFARSPVLRLAVPGRRLRRQGLALPLTGEVAAGPSLDGSVIFHHLNRPLPSQPLLPAGLAAVAQDPRLVPLADYSGWPQTEAWERACQAVQEAASNLIGRLAQEGGGGDVLSWGLAAWEGLSEVDRKRVQEAAWVPLTDGSRTSLRALAGQAARSGIPFLAGPGRPQRPMLRLSPEAMGPAGDLLAQLGLTLVDGLPELQREQRRRARARRLRGLSGQLGPCWVWRPVTLDGLQGSVGIPKGPVRLWVSGRPAPELRRITLLEEGQPVGWHRPRMPLVGVLSGRFPQLPETLEVGLARRAQEQLQSLAGELYEELARDFVPAQHRLVLLEYLLTEWQTARRAGSILTSLPLIRCHQGWTSLDALEEELRTRRELVALEPGMPPPPGEARLFPVLGEAEQTALLMRVAGSRLKRMQGPKKLELAALVPDWLQRPLKWPGSRHLARAGKALAQLADWLASTPIWEEKPAAGPPRVAPEQRLLSELRRRLEMSIPRKTRRHLGPVLEGLRWGRFPLGGVSWWDAQGHLTLNLCHAALRRALVEEDEGAVNLLMVYVFCEVNRRLEAVTDAHEREFLHELGVSLAQASAAADC